ncbi:alpha/beta hydrolase-fold protein [uncultured Winogradskyella sp.]|uniref:alpha/beta hydrolase-fold protein n=1 Tax=uncultured Winogradskyella sp. TaxID=395353 RepID=UPI0030DAE86C|tara:strand:- start:164866 stop:166110 length:1245 start_codon:yes stop_codon:yes gene_type:complete
MKETIQFSIVLLLTFCFSVNAQTIQVELQQAEIRDSIYSKNLDSYRHYWVKLPDNYNPKSDAKYPVVYLLDGFSLKENLEVVYNNYWGHYLPHMILVGISNRTNRTLDLTTSKVDTRRGSRFNYKTGGADLFTSFLENELIPTIDQNYPTTSFRTLIGHSYAGLFTTNMLLNHSHVFKNYIVIDPSLDWDDQKLLKQAQAELKSKSLKGKRLFVALAAEQLHMSDETITIDNLEQDESEFTLFSRSILEFCDLVASTKKHNGLNFNWKVYPEDLHGTVPLPAIRDGLVSLFKWYQFKSPQTYNNPETALDDIRMLLNNQETIYKEHFGYSVPPMVEELFVGYGYMNLQMEQPEKALLFFDMAIKYYPKSANVYDAMSDYYIAKKDNKKAIQLLENAFEISKSKFHKEKLDALKE